MPPVFFAGASESCEAPSRTSRPNKLTLSADSSQGKRHQSQPRHRQGYSRQRLNRDHSPTPTPPSFRPQSQPSSKCGQPRLQYSVQGALFHTEYRQQQDLSPQGPAQKRETGLLLKNKFRHRSKGWLKKGRKHNVQKTEL